MSEKIRVKSGNVEHQVNTDSDLVCFKLLKFENKKVN